MNKKLLIIFFTLLIVINVQSAYSHNPLLKSNNNNKNIEHKVQNPFYPSFYTQFINRIVFIQKEFNKKLSILVNEIKSGKKGAIFLIIFFSFLYGIIHAAGPGHGKTLVGSYFLSKNAPFVKGAIAGFSIAVIHSISAISIIGLIYLFIKKSTLVNFENYNHVIRSISYSLIVLIGFFMITKTIYTIFKHKFFNNDENAFIEKSIKNKDFKAIVSAAGIVPCPGAAMILIFSMNEGLFFIGIISVLFMSIGMALTITIIAEIIIISKKAGIFFLSGKQKSGRIFQISTELLSGIIILFFGIILLIAN